MKLYNKVLKKLQKQSQFDLAIAAIQEDIELQIDNNHISELLQQRRDRIYRGR